MQKQIANNAFQGDVRLRTVSAPKATSIGAYAFENCKKITSRYTLTVYGQLCFDLRGKYIGDEGSIYLFIIRFFVFIFR